MVAGAGPRDRGGVRGLQPGRRPGRAGLRRPQRGRLGARARRWLARAQFAEELVVCDLELAASGRRAAGRGRARARRRRRRAPPPACSPGSRHPRRAASVEPQLAEPLEPDAEVYEALKLGLRDYVRKNGFERVLVAVSGGIDSALVAADRRRRARARAGQLRRHALPPLQRRDPGRRAGDRRATSGAELIEIPIEPAMHAYEELLAASGDGTALGRPGPGTESARELETAARGRAGGGEHPGANPRQPDDGPLEPVRLAGPDDRQQERDVGRLRDPLRRHGGRLRGDQGRAEDARVPSWSATATSSPDAELVPRVRARARAVGRASPRPARPGLAAALRAARPHPRRLRRGGPRPRRDRRRRASPPRSSTR